MIFSQITAKKYFDAYYIISFQNYVSINNTEAANNQLCDLHKLILTALKKQLLLICHYSKRDTSYIIINADKFKTFHYNFRENYTRSRSFVLHKQNKKLGTFKISRTENFYWKVWVLQGKTFCGYKLKYISLVNMPGPLFMIYLYQVCGFCI